MSQILSEAAIQSELLKLNSNWILMSSKDQIQRTYSFDNYDQTMAFANGVAAIAQQNNHHPDMLIRYSSCQVNYSTHSAKGLTSLDFICANAIDNLII